MFELAFELKNVWALETKLSVLDSECALRWAFLTALGLHLAQLALQMLRDWEIV